MAVVRTPVLLWPGEGPGPGGLNFRLVPGKGLPAPWRNEESTANEVLLN